MVERNNFKCNEIYSIDSQKRLQDLVWVRHISVLTILVQICDG